MWFVLSKEKDLEKELEALNLDEALSAADKVTDFLNKSLAKPVERYMVARLISILYEETFDCSLGPEFEAKIRGLAKQNQ